MELKTSPETDDLAGAITELPEKKPCGSSTEPTATTVESNSEEVELKLDLTEVIDTNEKLTGPQIKAGEELKKEELFPVPLVVNILINF